MDDEAGEVSAYPNLKATGLFVGKVIVASIVLALYGEWRYHAGFRTGVDAAICAMQIAVQTGTLPQSSAACRAMIRDHAEPRT